MRKFEDVDIPAALGAVVEMNTVFYKSDFQYDIQQFNRAADRPDGENNQFLWLSRYSGTECFPEQEVYIRELFPHKSWCYHAEQNDRISAFAVEITGKAQGEIRGNLYELDYAQHVRHVRRDALPLDQAVLTLASGEERRISGEEYQKSLAGDLDDKYGEIAHVRFGVEREGDLQQTIRLARAERKTYTPARFNVRVPSVKLSIRDQLEAGQEAAMAHSAPAKKKSAELEV